MGNETTGSSNITANVINIVNGAKYELDWGDTITAATINNTDSSKLTIIIISKNTRKLAYF